MIVKLVLFAAVKDIVGERTMDLTLESASNVGQLRSTLIAKYPEAESLIEKSAISVNHSYANDATVIPDSAEVAVIPPVSGG